MRTLISKHEIDEISVSWTLLLSLLALTTARFTLVTLSNVNSIWIGAGLTTNMIKGAVRALWSPQIASQLGRNVGDDPAERRMFPEREDLHEFYVPGSWSSLWMVSHSIPSCRGRLVPRRADGVPDCPFRNSEIFQLLALAHASGCRSGFHPEYRASVSGVLAFERVSEYIKMVGSLGGV